MRRRAVMAVAAGKLLDIKDAILAGPNAGGGEAEDERPVIALFPPDSRV